MKKLVCLALIIMIFSLCGCGVENQVTSDKMDVEPKPSEMEFLQQFDLSDDKIHFSNSGIDFYADRVVVVLKKSVPDLKINLEDFCLNNGESIYFYDFANKDNPNYHHILTIYLKERGTEKVIEAVTELNKLEFVRYAGPQYIYEIQNDRV